MADEVQIKDAKEYPYWKILAWRFVRTAVAGGAGAVVAVTVVLKPDLANIKEYSFALLAAFIAGAVSAVALWVRDTFGNRDKDSVVDKLPL